MDKIKTKQGINTLRANKEKYIEELKQYNVVQLEEIRDRQLHLLTNKKRLDKLPDKGKRIQNLYDTIELELANRNEINKAAELFSKLNLVENGIKALNTMEWLGKYQPTDANIDKNSGETLALDSDDTDDDSASNPLKIIAQSRNTSNKKIVKIEKPIPSLITKADLDEIETFKINKHSDGILNSESQSSASSSPNEKPKIIDDKKSTIKSDETKSTIKSDDVKSTISSSNSSSYISLSNHDDLHFELEPHAHYLCQKEFHGIEKHKFLPHKTTKSDCHSVDKEKARKISKNWENTSATPPTMRNTSVKILSLPDSIEVQRQQIEKLKVLQEKHAEERLLMLRSRPDYVPKKIVEDDFANRKLGKFFKTYREHNEIDDNDDDDDDNDDRNENLLDDLNDYDSESSDNNEKFVDAE